MTRLMDQPSKLETLEPVESPASFTWVERLRAHISIARPDHWFKNGFMVLGALLAYFYDPSALFPNAFLWLCWGLVITCLTASTNYVINEILDAPHDLSHPTKWKRPIPSGKANLRLAYVQWIVLGIISLGLATTMDKPFFLSTLLLLVMGLVYNVPPIRSKDIAYLDVLSESVNNPIRLLLGWYAVTAGQVPPISLLIAYWMLGAFFMATKRFAEYRCFHNPLTAGEYRRSFRYYDEDRLLSSMVFYATTFSLFLGVFIIRYHLELILSVPLISGFIAYYLSIALKQDSPTQAPERLYRESGLMAYLVVCLLVFSGLMFTRMTWLYDAFNVKPSAMPALWHF